jgi:hypothetical protein
MLLMLERFIEYIKEHEDVQFVTMKVGYSPLHVQSHRQ